jgi:hypothetical protein
VSARQAEKRLREVFDIEQMGVALSADRERSATRWPVLAKAPFAVNPPYSARSVSMGSIVAARRAGT